MLMLLIAYITLLRMFSKRILFFILLIPSEAIAASFFTATDSIFPQERYINFVESEGLKSKVIYSITQDREGFLWLGTNAGVFRYDGRFFRRFTVDDGLSDNEVFTIYQDRSDRIWFLTFNGKLSFWKNGKIFNPDNTPFLRKAFKAETIYSCYEDSQGRLWFGMRRKGFIIVHGDSVEFNNYLSLNNILNSVYVHEDLSGHLWTFKIKRMHMISQKNNKDTIFLPDNVDMNTFSRGPNGVSYFVSANGVFKLFDRSCTLFIPASMIPHKADIVNIFSSGDYIWITTLGKGCYEYINGRFNKRYFKDMTFVSVFKDRENNIWLGTSGKSLLMVPPKNPSITNYTRSTGLSGERITSIATGNDRIWLGYGNGAVDEVSNNKKRKYLLNNQSNETNFFRVTSIIADNARAWIGTDYGIYLIENGKQNFIQYNKNNFGEEYYSIKRMIKDSRNDIYATYTFNLLKMEKRGKEYYMHDIIDSVGRTFSLVENDRGEIIVSEINGLMKYIPGNTYSTYKTDHDFYSERIVDMKTDDDHYLLMASDGFGLFILNGEKLVQHITTKDGLSSNICNHIYVSGNNMYVATNEGVNILRKENNRYFVSKIINAKSGLLSDFVNDISINNKIIYVGTDKGLSIINDTFEIQNSYVGKINITEVITDTIQVISEKDNKYKSDIPRLLIRFAYPVFNPDNQVNVKYRLLQNDTDKPEWIISTNNEVEFSSLRPGDYILQLIPDVNGDSYHLSNFNFTITPLWWQTTSAGTGFTIAVLMLIIFTVRRGIKKRFETQVIGLKQKSMLDTERNRIASDMHDDIGADLTKISMWSNILDGSDDKAKKIVGKIAHLSTEVLQKMDQIIWALDSVHNHSEDMISYIREYASHFLEGSGFKLRFDEVEIPDFKISAFQRRNIFLVIKELLHNSVKHSLAELIGIKIYHENHYLKIEYFDNGKGISNKETREGIGFITMKNRLDEINSTIVIDSTVGKGVSVIISIPLAE